MKRKIWIQTFFLPKIMLSIALCSFWLLITNSPLFANHENAFNTTYENTIQDTISHFNSTIPDQKPPFAQVHNPLQLPKFEYFINDYAQTLSSKERNQLDQLAQDLQHNHGPQVVTLLFPHRKGNELFDIALKAFNENGIWDQQRNDGLLLAIATEEKKIRIMVGYGLESTIPDILASQIIEEQIRPLVNQGDFAGAINAFYTNILPYLDGSKKYKNPDQNWHLLGMEWHYALLVILVELTILIMLHRRFFLKPKPANHSSSAKNHNSLTQKTKRKIDLWDHLEIISFRMGIISFMIFMRWVPMASIHSITGKFFLPHSITLLFFMIYLSFQIKLNIKSSYGSSSGSFGSSSWSSSSSSSRSSWSSSRSSSSFSGGGGRSGGGGAGD